MVVEALGPLTESPDPCCADGPFTVLHWIAELLIDCEEDRTLRAVLVGMLREGRPATAPSGMQAPDASDDQEGRGSRPGSD